jgi:hypothetical protein
MDAPFLTIAEAANQSGVHESTIRRRAARIGLDLIPDRLDRRRMLIRRTDLDLLTQPGAMIARDAA